MKMLFIIFLSFLAINVVKSDDVCSASFTGFLQCLATDAGKGPRDNKETSPELKKAVQNCFTGSGCEEPDFSKANLSYFYQEPWLTRASDILDLLENVDPKVKDCMARSLLETIRSRINECVQGTGADDVKDFELPPLPDVRNIDITKLKEVVLNRLMVRVTLEKCNQTKGTEANDNTINCIVTARKKYDQSLCTLRNTCRDQNITDQPCRDRFDKVHTAVCDCANTNGASAAGNAQAMLMNGKLEKQFKKCHSENNVPYPDDRVKKVHQAIQQSILDVKNHQPIPPVVKQTLSLARQTLQDFENQWKGAFCAECTQDAQQPGTDSESEFLKKNGGN